MQNPDLARQSSNKQTSFQNLKGDLFHPDKFEEFVFLVCDFVFECLLSFCPLSLSKSLEKISEY